MYLTFWIYYYLVLLSIQNSGTTYLFKNSTFCFPQNDFICKKLDREGRCMIHHNYHGITCNRNNECKSTVVFHHTNGKHYEIPSYLLSYMNVTIMCPNGYYIKSIYQLKYNIPKIKSQYCAGSFETYKSCANLGSKSCILGDCCQNDIPVTEVCSQIDNSPLLLRCKGSKTCNLMVDRIKLEGCDGMNYNCNSSYNLCYSKWAEISYVCEDINDCEDNPERCEMPCQRQPDLDKCECESGYFPNSKDSSCRDINECNNGISNCDHLCRNQPGSYNCECKKGYVLEADHHSCKDIDHCHNGSSNCDHFCVNQPGSYTCLCRMGFYLDTDQHSCKDIDECHNGISNCDHFCRNNPGSYTCLCRIGYYLDTDEHSCKDINECRGGISKCDDLCRNQPGSYTCECRTGYYLDTDQHSCKDSDECEDSPERCSKPCQIQLDSNKCQCETGYFNSDDVLCKDINECHIGIANCDHLCRNQPGSYKCECRSGYYLKTDKPSRHSCQDINECEIDNGNCSYSCVNKEGGYDCTCQNGFLLDSDDNHTCLDINECEIDNGNCSYSCVNKEGGYDCTCKNGFLLDSDDNHTCLDINECENNNAGCSHSCVNKEGGYNCTCDTGFVLLKDSHMCQVSAVIVIGTSVGGTAIILATVLFIIIYIYRKKKSTKSSDNDGTTTYAEPLEIKGTTIASNDCFSLVECTMGDIPTQTHFNKNTNQFDGPEINYSPVEYAFVHKINRSNLPYINTEPVRKPIMTGYKASDNFTRKHQQNNIADTASKDIVERESLQKIDQPTGVEYAAVDMSKKNKKNHKIVGNKTSFGIDMVENTYYDSVDMTSNKGTVPQDTLVEGTYCDNDDLQGIQGAMSQKEESVDNQDISTINDQCNNRVNYEDEITYI